jgi:hypothetical protein
MRGGYVQELAVLMRTLIECSTHIEFVLGREPSGEHRSAVKKYVTDFFADFQRDPSVELRRAQVPQGLVNRTLGQTLDRFADEIGESTDRTPAEKLFSNSYRILSNYVHAKYPEAMDLYGGRPGRFHLRGMSNTPKDIESIETLRTFVRTAWTTFKYMILEIDGLATLVLRDPELLNWYSQFSEGV